MIKELKKNIYVGIKKLSLFDYKCNKRELPIEINDIEYIILLELRNFLNFYDSGFESLDFYVN